jgi:hypothetical protein
MTSILVSSGSTSLCITLFILETNNSGNIILNSSSVEIYDKSLDVSEKSNSDDDFIEDDYLQGCSSSSDKKCDNDLDSEFSEKVIKEFQNKHKFSLW